MAFDDFVAVTAFTFLANRTTARCQ